VGKPRVGNDSKIKSQYFNSSKDEIFSDYVAKSMRLKGPSSKSVHPKKR
jgi:hypothetical protein